MYYLESINSSDAIVYILIRTIIIYIYAILLVRFGNKRFGIQTPFDFIIVVITGSILGRTIYGGASLIAMISASFVLFFLHYIFAIISFKSSKFGQYIKGKPAVLVQDGNINWDMMRQTQITKDDLQTLLRSKLHFDDLSIIKEARLERTGDISFILKNK